MNTSALVLMINVMSLVTFATLYFFIKVLMIPPRKEPDSYSENDDDNEPSA